LLSILVKILMLQRLRHHPYIKSSLDSLWALVGGVSIRTKILGIVLALTIVLGLGITGQVREVMYHTLLDELERLGQALVHDFAAPITNGDGAIVRIGLTEIRLNNIISHLTNQMIFTTLLVALVGVMAAILLTWLLNRPILILYSISFETYTFILTIWSPQFFAGCPQMIADSYAKSVTFI